MANLDIDSYWEDFNKEITIRLNNAIKYLHIAFDRRNDCIYHMKEYKNSYVKYGVNISNIYIINNRSKIYYNREQKSNLGVKLCSYINSYNYLVYEKIPNLEKNIKILNAIRNYPRDIYSRLQLGLNHEITKHLLKGNAYSFGSNLGSLKIYIKAIDHINSTKINWFKSFGFYNELLKKGYTPKTKKNPNGIDWHIHSNIDCIAIPKFKCFRTHCLNANYYKFNFGYTHDVHSLNSGKATNSILALKDKTFNEIIEDRSLNSMNKLSAICYYFDDLKYELYDDIKTLIKQK